MKKTRYYVRRILLFFASFFLFAAILCGCKEEPVISSNPAPEVTVTPTQPSVPDVTEPSVTDPTETNPSEPDPTEPDPTDPPETKPSKPSLTDPVEPDIPEIEPDVPGGELSALPLRNYPSENGFLVLNDSDDVFFLDCGEFVRVSCTDGSASVEHAGEVYPLEYRWCQYGNQLYINKYSSPSEDAEITAVKHSAVYASVHFGTQTSIYVYLMNAQTGEVTDPLSALDPVIKERICHVEFSPDGTLAFVSYNGNGKALLLDCSTGAILDEFNDDGIYNTLTGYFLAGNRILFCVNTTSGNRFKIYSLYTGEIEDCTNLLVPDRETDDIRINFISDTKIGIVGDSSVYLSDLTAQESFLLNMKNVSNRTHFFPCADGKIGVIHENVVYVVDLDAGTMTPVLRIGDVTQ